MLVFLVFVCFCVICLVLLDNHKNNMQALYMDRLTRHFVLCTVCRKLFPLWLKVCNYDSKVMKMLLVFTFFCLFVCFIFCFLFVLFVCFLIKSTTLLWIYLPVALTFSQESCDNSLLGHNYWYSRYTVKTYFNCMDSQLIHLPIKWILTIA